MAIWAIADLHLSFGTKNKTMERFGKGWVGHPDNVRQHWVDQVHPEDLVLLAGDFSWAMTLDEVKPDFAWLDNLPGTKVMIKGNHDYWWGSLAKIKAILPPNCHVLQNDAFLWKDVAIGGARLWDTDEYHFTQAVDWKGDVPEIKEDKEREAIFVRELQRLELSLRSLDKNAKMRIVMTHYPPISADLRDSRVSALLERYSVDVCLFGHLHSLLPNQRLFGEKNGIHYYLTSCDYLDFKPLRIV